MRRFTHTFPQRISAFLLCLALLIGLLPVTSLAAGSNTVYVGGVALTGSSENIVYATTNENGEVTTEGATTDNYNIKWDGSTLTLRGATIKNELYADQDPLIYITGAAIGVFNQSGDANLTITLEGTNTIKDVSYGICVLAPSNGSAKLTITGSGSLDVSATSTGIRIHSHSGDAAVSIKNAKVTATAQWASGVNVRCGTNSSASLTVNGGNLTSSGKPGILYDTLESSILSTIKFIVSNSALVDARGGGIGAGSLLDLKEVSPADDSVGIVFGHDRSDSKAGTVYGDVTLQEDLEIGEGESLTLDDGASLNAGDYDVIVDGGTVDEDITTSLGDSVIYKVTKVELNKTSLTLDVNESETLTATITPDNATNKNVTWSSDNTSVATVDENGKVTAVAQGGATITVTTEDGSKQATCSVTVTQPVTGVTLNKNTLELYTGKRETLIATVEPSDATNPAVNWSSDKPEVATVDNGVVTAVGAGTATITVATVDGGYTATCAVTVEKPYTPPPYIPPSKPNWTSVARKLANAQPGDTVTVKMNGETEVPGEVWETIAGRDVTVILDMGGNVSWTVDGNDVPTATHFADMDFGVDRNTTGIDVDVINAITGQVSSVQITLAHDGEFGFTLTLTAPLGRENAGRWANLYHYDEDAESLSYETSAEIQKDGTASLKMTHASQYAIVIDDQAHQLPFEDVTSGTWYEGAVRYAYLHDIMEGMSATTFQPNGTLTRAMAVQIFYNLEGQPDISGENLGYPYEDVNAQAWYGNAVYWARLTGVATGYGDGTFQPTDSITRQEFAQMLYNYAKYKGCDLTAEGDLATFPDGNEVQEWALPAMLWANGNALINGHDDGTLEPGGTTTRAQAAAILMRFDQDLAE